eukprot:TRINITY_DN2078_c0_g1_i5.p1 TRINITY_DN2078_c0_g1~~TRINITY_DN2078_c0_g1_i5.p1  ORF type:complete len:236 (+),score=61.95 TRINITY_DN2078_c0_g1_i5:52-708(+)
MEPSTTDELPILYSYWRSTCSWRVRIALEMKQIKVQIHPVNLVADGGQQLKPEYEKINPEKQVPTLFIDGHHLTQSLAIIEYLEETRANQGLPILPKDPIQRAQSRSIANLICANIQPIQNLKVLNYVGPEKKMEWAKHWITQGFIALEKTLKQTAGKYCVGDLVSLADLCLVPQLYNARRFNVDLAPFNTCLEVEKNLVILPFFKAAAPEVQPDAQV